MYISETAIDVVCISLETIDSTIYPKYYIGINFVLCIKIQSVVFYQRVFSIYSSTYYTSHKFNMYQTYCLDFSCKHLVRKTTTLPNMKKSFVSKTTIFDYNLIIHALI